MTDRTISNKSTDLAVSPGPNQQARTAIQDNILQTIGQTPLVRLHKSVENIAPIICAKVESFNPGGSTKDRVALNMILEAERSGALRSGGTVIEATAGNTGLGLALVSAVRGYRCIFVLPDKMSDDKIRLLRSYGAEVVITPTNVPPDSPESYNGVANRLASEIEGAWRAGQFTNLANPQTHYEQTGPEIWEQTAGRITVFVAAAGTGGTISGVGEFLKEKNPKIRVIGADIEGSVLSGGTPGSWKVEGIGEDFVPSTLNAQVIDEWIRISDADSFLTARKIARQEGILLGGSSGTCLAAAFRYALRCTENDLIVALCADTGRNYLSKMYDDLWMSQQGYTELPPEQATAGDLLALLGREEKLIYLQPDDSLQRAAEIFKERGISQLPVIENGKIVGAIQEITIVHALHRGTTSPKVRLREIMARPMPQVNVRVLLEEIYRLLLAGNSAVAVIRDGRPIGLITRSDLMEYYDRVAT
ncbi:MAG TPA: pyridoxal-phosphate dependent enzyme [Terriglobales bacterium]|nr:pyridoxal-phosphate dependent enzyme [Terriglobales bacterium]